MPRQDDSTPEVASVEYYIGLMSGSSCDGVDCAIVDFDSQPPRLLATHYLAYEPAFRKRLRALSYNQALAASELAYFDRALTELAADAVHVALARAGLRPAAIRAIGMHGHTVCHLPHAPHPYSLQIGDPNRLTVQTGITVVADFRRRDQALGGQGAPLAPGFHRAVFQHPREARAVINLGGIANVTILPAACEPAQGFDTGPANTLLDAWAQRHLDTPHDEGGHWAASGRVHAGLLAQLLQESYFLQPPPKSTSQHRFHLEWLLREVDRTGQELAAADIQATLAQLTVETVANAIESWAPATQCVLLCGGGTRNRDLVCRLRRRLRIPVCDCAEYGFPADWIEAAAFAWLARQTVYGLPGNVPEVTGARAATVLGGVYQT